MQERKRTNKAQKIIKSTETVSNPVTIDKEKDQHIRQKKRSTIFD